MYFVHNMGDFLAMSVYRTVYETHYETPIHPIFGGCVTDSEDLSD